MLQTSQEASLIYLSKKYVELLEERHREVENYLTTIKKSQAISPNLLNISTFEETLGWLKRSIEYKRGILRNVNTGVGLRNMEAILSYIEFYDQLLKRISYFLHQFNLSSSNAYPELNAFMYDFLDRFDIKNDFIFTIGTDFSVYFPGTEINQFSDILDNSLVEKLRKLPYFVSIPLIDIDNWKKLPALIHEASHIVDNHKKITLEILESIQHRRLDDSLLRLTHCWISEIVADITSVRYLGPPYLYLFLNSPDYLVHESINRTHPPMKDRIKLIFQELQNMGFSNPDFRQEIETVFPVSSPISVDSDFANSVVEIVRSKTGDVVLSKDHFDETYSLIFPCPIHQSLCDSFKYPSFQMEKRGNRLI